MKIFTILPLLITLVLPSTVSADWQETLDAQFDIVSTFDELQDWYGSSIGGTITNPIYMPKKLDGSASVWNTYDQWYTGDSQHIENWIGSHAVTAWSGAKSAAINYSFAAGCYTNPDDVKGYGPERLGLYYGDGTKESGNDEQYVFFMMKFDPGFWPKLNETDFAYTAVIKFFDIVGGFIDPDTWGYSSDNAGIMAGYGTNFTLWNIGGGDASHLTKLAMQENTHHTREYTPPYYYYDYYDIPYGDPEDRHGLPYWGTIELQDVYNTEAWFGIEYRINMGTLDNYDGEIEMWLYNQSGVAIGHYLAQNLGLKRVLDTKYNKVVFGGNYQCTSVENGNPTTTTWYLDDVILDSSRIGPTYFGLLNGTTPGSISIGSGPHSIGIGSGNSSINLQ